MTTIDVVELAVSGGELWIQLCDGIFELGVENQTDKNDTSWAGIELSREQLIKLRDDISIYLEKN